MLGIKINNESLDLPPGATMELERVNPFLQLDNEILGDYSLPFTVQSSDKNLRLLQYAGVIQKRVDNSGIEAIVYDLGEQEAVGKIKIEKPRIHLNHSEKGSISCYFLSGTSSFFQDIKEAQLRDVPLGGDRSFAWDAFAASGPGFWGHITTVATAAPNTYDYAIFPVKNMQWPSTRGVTIEVMNEAYLDGSTVKLKGGYIDGSKFDLARIVPFPYLHYVLSKIFEDAGWTLGGDLLTDPTFKKITLINFQAINWGYIKKQILTDVPVYKNPVVFNLQEHVPDMLVADFILYIKNRFGIWYDFDRKTKRATIKLLSNIIDTTPKDLTRYTDSVVPKAVAQDQNIYALRNQFATDLGDGAPNFEVVSLQGEVDEVTDLPAATEAQYAHVYLVVGENNYYICSQNQTTEAWEWSFYAYNIYDYEPAGSNKEITTAATTVGMENHSSYLDLIPRIDNLGNWFGITDDQSSWGIHLCFFHGLKDNKLGDPYPYGSSHIYDSTMAQVADWALSFECKKIDGTEVGLREVFWKPFLDVLNSSESFELTLYLPRHIYANLKFSDKVIIDGVMMIITNIKAVIPYKEVVACEAVRVF